MIRRATASTGTRTGLVLKTRAARSLLEHFGHPLLVTAGVIRRYSLISISPATMAGYLTATNEGQASYDYETQRKEAAKAGQCDTAWWERFSWAHYHLGLLTDSVDKFDALEKHLTFALEMLKAHAEDPNLTDSDATSRNDMQSHRLQYYEAALRSIQDERGPLVVESSVSHASTMPGAFDDSISELLSEYNHKTSTGGNVSNATSESRW